MKTRFVNVWDNIKGGYIGFIVLQVEETDEFLIKKNFNPGYKFVIQAWYNHVGAAGGHTFIPDHGEGIQKKSRKIETNEADVFGLYLSNVEDIYDIPGELYTENYWGIMNTKTDYYEVVDYPPDEYYKILYKRRIWSINKLTSKINENDEFKTESLNKINFESMNKKFKNDMLQMGADLNQESTKVYCGYVNKNNLKLQEVCSLLGSDKGNIVNKYLWIPNDEMPNELWNKVKNVNKYNEAIAEGDELYFSKNGDVAKIEN